MLSTSLISRQISIPFFHGKLISRIINSGFDSRKILIASSQFSHVTTSNSLFDK